MNDDDGIVCVVDDDDRVREALSDLLSSFALRTFTFGSAAEYLAFARPAAPACLVLDIGLPDINGLDLQRQMGDADHPHIVFITGSGDIASSVRAMKAGAVDFLTKPFTETAVMGAIRSALDQNRQARLKEAERTVLRGRLSSLTPREMEVLCLVVRGFLNKQAAAELGISEVTLQIHRSRIMQKMAAGSLAELVRIANALDLPIGQPGRRRRAI